MTQDELAKKLKVKRLTVLRWENDQVEIPHVVDLALREIEREEKS